MVLFNIIEEQVTICFTGRVNVLERKSNRFLGAIFLSCGQIVGSTYKSKKGKSALFQIIYDFKQENDEYSFVVEPEIIENSLIEFSLSYKQLIEEWEEFEKRYNDSKKYIPPTDLKLMVKDSFIKDGDNVSANEFELLSMIAKFSDVKEIYEKCSLFEYEITAALVSLRKKDALLTQSLYLGLGAAGLPLFTGLQGGMLKLLGPTGGYIVGFILSAVIVSRIIENSKADNNFLNSIMAMSLGIVTIYAAGVLWLCFYLNISWMKAFFMGAVPFIAADIIKVIIAAAIYTCAGKRIRTIFK